MIVGIGLRYLGGEAHKSMEDAFAFLCSENDTVLVAVGNTIAVDLYKGVKNNEITIHATNAIAETMMIILRFRQIKRRRF